MTRAPFATAEIAGSFASERIDTPTSAVWRPYAAAMPARPVTTPVRIGPAAKPRKSNVAISVTARGKRARETSWGKSDARAGCSKTPAVDASPTAT